MAGLLRPAPMESGDAEPRWLTEAEIRELPPGPRARYRERRAAHEREQQQEKEPPLQREKKPQQKQSRQRQRRRKQSQGKQPPREDRPRSAKAWRFDQYDRVHCNLGGDVGWASGNVQTRDERTDEGLLPYVVMLDPPIKKLISVPADANSCLLPSVCFAEGPAGGACAAKIAASATAPRGKMRFAVGDRVCCLCAGPDGTDWPRRWSSGTVSAVWHRPAGAAEGAALPYLVDLDAGAAGGSAQERPAAVLVHRDDHMYVRSLDLQPAGECRSQASGGVGLQRFTVRRNAEHGWDERADQQTLIVRKVSQPTWTDSDSDSDSGGR